MANQREPSEDRRVLFLIRGHQEFESDELVQKSTWARDSKHVSFYWLHGNECDSKIDLQTRRIYHPFSDTRQNMLRKVIFSIRALASEMKPDLLVLTTTNTYFDCRKIPNMLNEMTCSNIEIAGHTERWSHKDETSDKSLIKIKKGDFFINGASMFLRPNAYKSLISIDLDRYKEIPDDIAITDHLKASNFEILHIKRNNMYQTHIFVPSLVSRVKGTNNLRHTQERMIDLHHYYLTNNRLQRFFIMIKIHLKEITRVEPKRLFSPNKFIRRIKRSSSTWNL